ncbi:MAG: hypothetical protein ACREFX_09170, partial [Opitutaceae bacterium]
CIPVDPRDPAVLPYRPDWFARMGAGALQVPELRAVAFRHPACALALLTADYERTRKVLEPALAGAGEAVYHLLTWSEAREVAFAGSPRTPDLDPAMRTTLIQDGYWGFRHARRTADTRLLSDVETWCGDQKRRYGSAAALHLMRHPREAVGPYREVVASNPFYAYLALPRLHPRGLRVGASDIGADPKWAWHFALSRFSPEPESFVPTVLSDPAWAVEYASARGWLGDPARRARLSTGLEARAGGHPLTRAAVALLNARVVLPAALAAGQAAEARTLDVLGRQKNTSIWRPSEEQWESEAFRRIVGPPRFTERGYPRGTIVDSADGGLAEIKSGGSALVPSYQLRLQAFRALVEHRSLRIYTSRPVSGRFADWLGPADVKIEPLPEP